MRDARELDPNLPAFGQAPIDLEECPECQGVHGRECGACGGLGHRPIPDPREERPAFVGDVAEFLRAYGMVEVYGVDGFQRLSGVAEFDAAFSDALAMFRGELERLRHEEEVEKLQMAKGQRAK